MRAREEKILSLALIAIAGGLLFVARDYAKDGTYVRAILILMIILCAINFIKQFTVSGKTAASTEDDGKMETMEDRRSEQFLTFKQAMLCLAVVLYLLGFYVIGFFPSTIIFMLVVPFILGYKKKKAIIITAIAMTALVYLIFFLYLDVYPIDGWLFSMLG